MVNGIEKRKKAKLNFIDTVFIAFCLFPFIIPNPIVVTNIQPNAAVFGTLVVCYEVFVKNAFKVRLSKTFFFAVTLITLAISVLVLFLTDITVESFRAFFNYYSVAIIPLAAFLVLQRIGTFPEGLIKALIIVWLLVSTIQFFSDRSFMTGIIGGVRFSYSYRGVVGLASEPSFFGIACFYFLHLAIRFKKKQPLFVLLILFMGIVYAQSMMGVLFIGSFLVVYLLDAANTRKGLYIWLAAIIALVGFVILLNTALVGTRLHQLFTIYVQGGTDEILNDASAGTRYDSLSVAINDSLDNYFLPLGYTRRIGSGYGGFLCELGFFALPVLWCISLVMSWTFKKRVSRVLYFVVVTILLFNNTQLGNPLLLLVLGVNLAFEASAIVTDGQELKEKCNGAASIR